MFERAKESPPLPKELWQVIIKILITDDASALFSLRLSTVFLSHMTDLASDDLARDYWGDSKDALYQVNGRPLAPASTFFKVVQQETRMLKHGITHLRNEATTPPDLPTDLMCLRQQMLALEEEWLANLRRDSVNVQVPLRQVGALHAYSFMLKPALEKATRARAFFMLVKMYQQLIHDEPYQSQPYIMESAKRTIFSIAASEYKDYEFNRLFLLIPIEINQSLSQIDINHHSLLHIAANEKNSSLVRWLVEKGAEINQELIQQLNLRLEELNTNDSSHARSSYADLLTIYSYLTTALNAKPDFDSYTELKPGRKFT